MPYIRDLTVFNIQVSGIMCQTSYAPDGDDLGNNLLNPNTCASRMRNIIYYSTVIQHMDRVKPITSVTLELVLYIWHIRTNISSAAIVYQAPTIPLNDLTIKKGRTDYLEDIFQQCWCVSNVLQPNMELSIVSWNHWWLWWVANRTRSKFTRDVSAIILCLASINSYTLFKM